MVKDKFLLRGFLIYYKNETVSACLTVCPSITKILLDRFKRNFAQIWADIHRSIIELLFFFFCNFQRLKIVADCMTPLKRLRS